MNSGKSKINLQGLIEFRKKLKDRTKAVSAQVDDTKSALTRVSSSWQDGNFKDFEGEFSQDVKRIKALVQELERFDNSVLKKFQEKLEEYLKTKYKY